MNIAKQAGIRPPENDIEKLCLLRPPTTMSLACQPYAEMKEWVFHDGLFVFSSASITWVSLGLADQIESILRCRK